MCIGESQELYALVGLQYQSAHHDIAVCFCALMYNIVHMTIADASETPHEYPRCIALMDIWISTSQINIVDIIQV